MLYTINIKNYVHVSPLLDFLPVEVIPIFEVQLMVLVIPTLVLQLIPADRY